MEGINAAIVGYLLLALAMPQLVRNRAMHNLAVGVVLVNLVVQALAVMLMTTAIYRAFVVVSMLLTAASLVLTVMAAGGRTFQQFVADMTNPFGTPVAPSAAPDNPTSSGGELRPPGQ
jgi:hypothetical protein